MNDTICKCEKCGKVRNQYASKICDDFKPHKWTYFKRDAPNRETTTSPELLPCPFCGTRANLISVNGEWWIACLKAGVCYGRVNARIGKQGPGEYGDAGFLHREDAIRLWNTRYAFEQVRELTADKEVTTHTIRSLHLIIDELTAERDRFKMKLEKIQAYCEAFPPDRRGPFDEIAKLAALKGETDAALKGR